jgi:hypothetical protein
MDREFNATGPKYKTGMMDPVSPKTGNLTGNYSI